jgi:hypothetical protein
LLPEDKSWALVEGVFRSQSPRYLLEWSSFAVDYHLQMANSGKSSTPRFGRFLKQRSSETVEKLVLESMFDKQSLTFTNGTKELIPGLYFYLCVVFLLFKVVFQC